jgi:HEAT repeat protein
MKSEPAPFPFSKLGLLIVGSICIVLAVFLISSKPVDPRKNESASQLKTPAPAPTPAITPVAMPDLRSLAMNLNGGASAPPTPAQLAEEKRVVAEQVGLAITWLKSTSVQTRIEGAEQLGAYPSTESTAALTAALRKDSSPEVRLAAAQSLSQSETPDTATVTALLNAIADTDEQVASTALDALAAYLEASPPGSGRATQIRMGLRAQSKNRRLPAALRQRLLTVLSNA